MAEPRQQDEPTVLGAARCPHAPQMVAMVELEGTRGGRIRSFSCGACEREWWQNDDEVIDLVEVVQKIRGLGLMVRVVRLRTSAGTWPPVENGVASPRASRSLCARIATMPRWLDLLDRSGATESHKAPNLTLSLAPSSTIRGPAPFDQEPTFTATLEITTLGPVVEDRET
jgi:hypothetical protein